MNDNNNIPNFELLAKYFAGEANNAEIQIIQDWIKDGKLEEFNRIKASWYAIDIKNVEFDTDAALLKVNKKISSSKRTKQIRLFTSIAAALILLITIPLLVLEYGKRDIQSEMISFVSTDSISVIQLDDGSKLTLNADSKVEYSEDFEENREIKLQGEAYFEVQHIDKENQFKVNTKNVSITVVGTKFNVKAIEESNIIEVSVTEGVVLVKDKNTDIESRLTKGQKITINTETEEFTLDSVSVTNDIFWITKKISFNNSSISEIASTLSKVYGIDVESRIENTDSIRISTGFEDKSLDEVLKILELTLDIQIIKSEGKIILEDAN